MGGGNGLGGDNMDFLLNEDEDENIYRKNIIYSILKKNKER
jgi:hypothetical protein